MYSTTEFYIVIVRTQDEGSCNCVAQFLSNGKFVPKIEMETHTGPDNCIMVQINPKIE